MKSENGGVDVQSCEKHLATCKEGSDQLELDKHLDTSKSSCKDIKQFDVYTITKVHKPFSAKPKADIQSHYKNIVKRG